MIYERIKDLAAGKRMSIAELERTLNFPNGMIGKWSKASPNSANLYKVAKYFNITMEDLIEESEVQENAKADSN